MARETMGPLYHKPMTGTLWRNSPMTGHQMQQSGQAMLKLPPLNLTDGIDFCSYASRRAFPGLLTALGGGDTKEKLEDALGKWKAIQQMAMHYSAQDERLSFVAKWSVIMACRQTSEARAKTDAPGSWNFFWGEVPTRCASFESLRSDAMTLAVDIDASAPTRTITIHLPTIIEGAPPHIRPGILLRQGNLLRQSLRTATHLHHQLRIQV